MSTMQQQLLGIRRSNHRLRTDPMVKFARGIQKYMDMSVRICSWDITNRHQARCKFFYIMVMAILKSIFIGFTLFSHRNSELYWLALFEFCVVVAILLMVPVTLLAMQLLDDASVPASLLIELLEKAGSFSILWFLPISNKLIYWYNNEDFLIEDFVTDPQYTRLHWVPAENGHPASPQFKPWSLQHWAVIRQRQFGSRPALFKWSTIPIFFGWITVRLFIPVFVLACGMLALPMTIMKFSTWPRLEDNISPFSPKGWSLAESFKVFGLLNQRSRIWSPQWNENVGYMRHISQAKKRRNNQGADAAGEDEATVCGRALMQIIRQCTYQKLYRCTCLLHSA